MTLEEVSAFNNREEAEVIKRELREEGSTIWLVSELVEKVFADLKVELDFLLVEVSALMQAFGGREVLIDAAIREVIVHVLDEVKKRMGKRTTNVEVGECFGVLARSMSATVFANPAVKKSLKTSISDKFSELVEKICRGQVLQVFTELRLELIRIIIAAKE